jgi:thiamine-phosphate pyrophosphorylase
MSLNLQQPAIYLITSGATTDETTPASDEYQNVLKLVEAAVAAKVDLLQIREKNLSDRMLYDLSVRARSMTRGSETRLLINDRSDIALAAEADGVHLTSRSIPTNVIREIYGPHFLVGVSTHSDNEVVRAAESGADFAVFGPVFETESKRGFGPPQGLVKLREIAERYPGFPILALGGITLENAPACVEAGAAGIAAIRLLNDYLRIRELVEYLRRSFRN